MPRTLPAATPHHPIALVGVLVGRLLATVLACPQATAAPGLPAPAAAIAPRFPRHPPRHPFQRFSFSSDLSHARYHSGDAATGDCGEAPGGNEAHGAAAPIGFSVTLVDDLDGLVRRLSTAYTLRGQVASVSSHDDPTPGENAVLNEVAFSYSRATEQGARQPDPLWGLPEGRDMQCPACRGNICAA